MDNYKRLISFLLLAVMTQLIFSVVFGFYALSVKKLEMNSILAVASELVMEDGYLDTDKLQIYQDNILKESRFVLEKGNNRDTAPDKLFLSISNRDLIGTPSSNGLALNETPQKGQIVELGIHMETELFASILPEALSKEFISEFTIPNRVVIRKWNKNREVLFNYYTGGYLDTVTELDILEFVDNGYNPDSLRTLQGKYLIELGD